ncbi:hypothetical protein V6N13_068602 [Hibiscus sabdariffa]
MVITLLAYGFAVVSANYQQGLYCSTCPHCSGTGVDNNETLKVYGSGGADPDRTHPGDLYVTVKVQQDPAILGGTIQVPTLKGDVVLKMVFNGVTRNVRECEGKFIAYSKSPYLMRGVKDAKLTADFDRKENA